MMKNLLMMILAGLFSMSASADRGYGSSLNIRLQAFGNYSVIFNNTTYFATENVNIRNIPVGKHFLRISETVRSRYGGNAVGKRLIFEGYVTVPAYSDVFTVAIAGRGLEVTHIERFYGYNHPGKAKGHYKKKGKDKKWDRDDDHDDDRGYDRYRDYEDYGSSYGLPGNGNGTYHDGTYGTSRLKEQPELKQKSENAAAVVTAK